MRVTKRVILSLSLKMYEQLAKQAGEVGLTIPAYIRHLIVKEQKSSVS